MDNLISFLSFAEPSVQYVTLGSVLLAVIGATIGCYTFLQKRALIGDAVSHAVLPGICLAFIVAQIKNPYLLLLGAFISGWLAILFTDLITRQSKIKSDTAIAIVLTFFFAIGLMLLGVIQRGENAAQAGLEAFLFGSAAALVRADVQLFIIAAIVIFIIIALQYRNFKWRIFDPEYAASIGMSIPKIDLLLTTLTVLAIALGIRTVGVVLMSALLITPAAAARYWTHKLSHMMLLAAIIGAFAGLIGAYISYTEPGMPTGPWIIIVVSAIAFFSMFFGSENGWYYRYRRQLKFRFKVLEENVLKIFYKLSEESDEFFEERTLESLGLRRDISQRDLSLGLKRLKKKKFVNKKSSSNWQLSEQGVLESKRIVRLHRLWELYLTEYLNIAPDHVHDDAEAIEHILTVEIQEKLEDLMKDRDRDPHNKKLPEISL